ncbi:MAG: hypothetical protein AB1805_02210 [Nitrospirota bacterium]
MGRLKSAAALAIGGALLSAARKRLPSAMDTMKGKMLGSDQMER